jgi:hypothetical protein
MNVGIYGAAFLNFEKNIFFCVIKKGNKIQLARFEMIYCSSVFDCYRPSSTLPGRYRK